MKKSLVLIFLMISVLFFVSCKKEQDKDTVAISTPIPTKALEVTPVPTQAAIVPENTTQDSGVTEDEQSTGQTTSEVTYDISEISYYSDASIKIYYPQLVHMENQENQDKINEKLRIAAIRYADGFDSTDQKNALQNDYIIAWKGTRLLSVRFLGFINSSTAAYPSSFSYTINIDLNTGEDVKLTDMFRVDDSFTAVIKEKGNSRYLYFNTNRELKEDTSFQDAEIQNTIRDYVFNTDDQAAFATADLEDASIHTYYTEDSLGISFDTVHAIGDHIQFEVKYSDLYDYLRQENSAWADFADALNSSSATKDESDGASTNNDFAIDENLIWKNINYLPGFAMLRDQSFLVDFENWGEVYFIAASGEGDFALNSLYLYLADSNSNILYEFPNFYGNGTMFFDLPAVSFQDVNSDGLKDVIIIAEYMTGVGPTGAQEFPIADVYFQTEEGFVSLPTVAEEINSSGQNDSISKVADYVKSLEVKLN